MGVVLTTYESWDDPPSIPISFFQLHVLQTKIGFLAAETGNAPMGGQFFWRSKMQSTECHETTGRQHILVKL